MSPTSRFPTIEELLRRSLFSGANVRVPDSEQWRTEFGRSLTLGRIASALSSATDGYMVELADLIGETIEIDPHLGCVINKRIGAISACDWVVEAAQGDGIDKDIAREVAEGVRQVLRGIPTFKQSIRDLAWGLVHGRSALENHWVTNAAPPFTRRVVSLGWVHPRRLNFGPCRELRVVDAMSYVGNFAEVGTELRAFWPKFIEFTPRLFNEYPEKEGLGPRALYWSFFKRFTARERMILIELFSKFIKIVEVDGEGPADPEDLDTAVDQADALSSNSVAQFPKGTKLRLEHPHPDSADAHRETISDCDKQISKLVLGNTSTTDAQSDGLNGRTAQVQKEEQNIFLESDGDLISGAFQTGLVVPLVVLNRGVEFERYAPTFRILTEPQKDRTAELQRAKLYLDLGGAMALDELREIAGYRKPADDEAIVQIVDSPQLSESARFIPPRARVIDPTGTEQGQDLPVAPPVLDPNQSVAAPVGQAPPTTEPNPSPDGAKPAVEPSVATQEPTASAQGPSLDLSDDDDWEIARGPLKRISGELAELQATEASDGLSNFPIVGENLRVSLRNSAFKPFPYYEAEALRAEWPDLWKRGGSTLANIQSRRLIPIAKRGGVVETDAEEEAVRLREAWALKHIADTDVAGVVAQVKWLVVGAQGLDRMRRILAEEKAKLRERGAVVGATNDHDALLLAKQPSTVYGSPETLVERGVEDGVVVLDKWAEVLANAVEGKETATAIKAALRAAAEHLRKRRDADLAGPIERWQVHSAMLGALDAEWEAENDQPIAPATFAGGPSGFATKPFSEALAFFKSKKVVAKSIFDKLVDAAKRAAFTIAGLAKKEMLETAFDELGKAVAAGRDLRMFRKALDARFTSAGWTKLNSSHVETVFRNATMGAYASGRKAQMTQPAVLKARPYWQIIAVKDDRTRDTHYAAHNKVLRASDPFWKTTPIPWGHNCFVAGTPVRTERGDVSIETLRTGDHVLTHRGRLRPVIDVHVNNFAGDLIEIELESGVVIRVTPEHPMLTPRGWVPAQNLGLDDEIMDAGPEYEVPALETNQA